MAPVRVKRRTAHWPCDPRSRADIFGAAVASVA